MAARISRDASYPAEDVFVNPEDGKLVLPGAWALPEVLPRYNEGFKKPFHFLIQSSMSSKAVRV